MRRPTKEELELVRSNSKLWAWLEARRGELRQIEEQENIRFEDYIFGLAEKSVRDQELTCPMCGAGEYASHYGMLTHADIHHRNFNRACGIIRKEYLKIIKRPRAYRRDHIKPIKTKLWPSDLTKNECGPRVYGPPPPSPEKIKEYGIENNWTTDGMGLLSVFNMLYMYKKDPNFYAVNKSRLVKLGLLNRRYNTPTEAGEELLANPPTT